MYKLIATLLLPSILYWAVTSAQLSGIVKDEQGNPLSLVELVFANKDTSLIVLTNDAGRYEANLPKGNYSLEVNYFGENYHKIKKITVGSRNLTRNFTLKIGIQYVGPIVEKDEELALEEVPKAMYEVNELNDQAPPPPPSVNNNYQDALVKSDVASRSGSVSASAKMRTPTPAGKKPSEAKERSGYERPEVYNYLDDTKQPGIASDSTPTQYNRIVENPFQKTTTQQYSTFSIDVDAASYANVRRMAAYGPVPPDAVRIEEMLNYFDYNYPQPTGNDPIRIETELGQCPWNSNHHLLMVGLQGRDMPKNNIPPGNFVFLVDVSGSMSGADRLPLVKQSLVMLLEALRPTDRVALVTYAGNTAVVLPSTPASEKATIKAAVENLDSGGGTAGASGIQLAYQTARANFKAQGNNRVILCTDGDFNVGVSSQEELVKLIEEERKSGVYLTVLGFGTGNYQDGRMQELADRGNGNHAYIDRLDEARKVLVKEFGGTLYTIAKDVKLQLVFNPDQVQSYRLIGYENRMLAKEDFNNDKKDAGELGAGHTVTALYEIVPNTKGKPGPLVELKFRYKPPTGEQASLLVEKTVPALCAVLPSENFMFAASVAECGLLLRQSVHKGTAQWSHVLNWAKNGLGTDTEGYRKEFVGLVEQYFSKR